jgi:hypothetical protein
MNTKEQKSDFHLGTTGIITLGALVSAYATAQTHWPGDEGISQLEMLIAYGTPVATAIGAGISETVAKAGQDSPTGSFLNGVSAVGYGIFFGYCGTAAGHLIGYLSNL